MAEKIPERIQLEIVTPSRQIFCDDVEEVTVPGTEGYLGVLPGHAPLLSELKPGVVSFRVSGDERRLFCGWGFVEVLPDRVSVLAEEAELPDEIDVDQATEDRAEAVSLLRSRSMDTDFEKALEQWNEAVARLDAAGLSRR